MNHSAGASILPGIVVEPSGQVSVDSTAGKFLIELAIELEDTVPQPVDVEHVLAAIVIAYREGRLKSGPAIAIRDPNLVELVREYLPVVFLRYGADLENDM
ncbi:MAG: hypothetical protein ACR2NZ_19170 [Rubripirellula sp.]